MTALQGIILGLIQGLTEFLPVSSSAHLVLAPSCFGWDHPGVFFDVMLHAGTLAAAVAYFRRDLVEMTRGARAFRGSDGKINTLWLLGLGTIPAAVLGAAGQAFFEGFFEKPAYAAGFLVVTGVLLVAADYFGRGKKGLRDITAGNALVVGAFQAAAILPGISRSGATMSAGMFAGMTRETAARFAFLLSIPIIAGTAVFKLKDIARAAGGAQTFLASLPGAAAAAISGYLAIRFMLGFVKTRRFTVFAVYCWALAALYLLTH